MSFVRANDDPDPVSPEDPLYYAPRAERGIANPRSNAAPQTRPENLPPVSPSSRFDEMREKAFVKSTRPLQSQFDEERRPSRWLVATGVVAGAIGVTSILAMVWFNVFPRSKSDPPELAVSISTPASATPAQAAASEDSEALLAGFKQFQQIQGSEDPAVAQTGSAATAKEAPEKSQVLLEKFIQWQRK
jgi:hypothetical protein